MSPLKTSLFTALIAAALTAGSFYLVQSRRNRDAASLRYANNRLRYDAALRRHAATATPAPTVPAPALAAPAPALSTSPAAPSPLPENYRDEGRATPVAALQTYAWACDRGDAKAVANLLYLDAPTRTKAEAYLASLPPPVRARWSSVDAMAATLLTAAVMEHPFPNADLLATATLEPVAAERVRVRLPGTPKDRIELQKTAAGWSYVLTEAVVDAYIARAKAASAGTGH